GLPQLPGAVDAVVGLPQLTQPGRQLAITHRPGRGLAGPGGVVGARSDLHACLAQGGADRLDSELSALHDVGTVVVDEGHDHLYWRSSSAPKKDAARFKISFARRSSRTSRSRAFTRSDSSVLTPATSPASMSACLTHMRTDSGP